MPLFNRPAQDYVRYQKKMLIANRLESQAALEDAKFNLQQTYKDLNFQIENQKRYQSIVDDLWIKIQQTEDDITNGRNLPNPDDPVAILTYINTKLSIINSFSDAWFNLGSYQESILRGKFSIQQVTGSFFDGSSTQIVTNKKKSPFLKAKR